VLALAAAWVLFPVVLLAVSAGLGLALDRILGRWLPGTLILPLGMASAIAIARLVTSADATAELALPLLILLALAGLAVGRDRLSAIWAERHALVAAGLVFLVVGAPAYLSLEPTFLGYLQLPDTGHQLAIASFVPDHGPDWEDIPYSSYSKVLQGYVDSEYPIAAQSTLGSLAPLGALDPAWLYHPFLAVLLAMAALSIYTLASAVGPRMLRAAVAFGGASSALVYSFALQGSIKEVAALAMLAAATAAGADLITSRRSAKGLLAVFVPAVAMLGSLGPAAGAYLAPLLLAVVGVAVVRAPRDRRRRELLAGLAVAVAALVLAAPTLAGLERAYDVNTAVLSGKGDSAGDIGNLAAPLVAEQAAGIWLSTDYRWEPRDSDVRTIQTWVSWFVAALAALGLVWAIVRRAWGPLLLFLALGPPSLVLFERGNPYADAKVMALLSSLALVLALLGASWLAGIKRLAGYAVACVVLGLLVVSQALTYHDSHPAPYERYEELLDVNERLSGTGPTLFTEWDEFGRYFLRDAEPYAQPTWRHGYRSDQFRHPDGESDLDHRPSLKTPYDIDDLSNGYVQSVHSIVLRRSPVVSRPPINFERTYRGEYYEIWERGDDRVTEHLPLGANALEPSAVPRCGDVRVLAEQAREVDGLLAAPPRPRLPVFRPGTVPSENWIPYVLYPGAVVLDSAGFVGGGPVITIPEGGDYRVWAEGSFGRPVTARVNHVAIGEVEYELGNAGQYLPFGEVTVEPGDQALRVEQAGGDLRPGNGGSLAGLRHLGPVVFSPLENEEPRVVERDPEDWRSLCGRRLDWVEVLVPGDA